MVVGWMAEAEGDTRLQSVCVRALVWMPAVKHINNSGQARVMPPLVRLGQVGGWISCELSLLSSCNMNESLQMRKKEITFKQ